MKKYMSSIIGQSSIVNIDCPIKYRYNILLASVLVQNTELLQAIPGLNDIGKALLGNI